eukprot:TRINITY_DN1756_c0_g1_i3.p2 TRINITY_DN1756_c0_g1~~TRINITY_DN1756_c0_g1_i3.p2  ORF type:complete len:141 (-),score=2.18 TRINITY_DN1756_c0_g1_i3:402-824(-)
MYKSMNAAYFSTFTKAKLHKILGLTSLAMSPGIEALINTEEVDGRFFNLAFENQKGETIMLGFFERKVAKGYDFAYGSMKCHFTLAPTIVVTHRKRKNLFSSSEWDSLRIRPMMILMALLEFWQIKSRGTAIIKYSHNNG